MPSEPIEAIGKTKPRDLPKQYRERQYPAPSALGRESLFPSQNEKKHRCCGAGIGVFAMRRYPRPAPEEQALRSSVGVCGPDLRQSHKARDERGSSSGQPQNKKVPLLEYRKTPIKSQSPEGFPSGLSGAATRIRTGDLILTKDVLYQLSHSSVPQEFFLVTLTIIANYFEFVNSFCKKICNKSLFLFFFCYFSRSLSKTGRTQPVIT